jgi:DNA-binding LacI/PurR family transcriptional regulator
VSARATVRDVAEAAGVSVGTVSHALNGTGRVAEATRASVLQAADRLGYRADPRARALRSRRTTTIGLVLPAAGAPQRAGEFVAADFYLELASATAQAALARDHGLLLLPNPETEADLRRFAIDGALLSDPEASDPRLDLFDRLEIPVVTLDRDPARPERSWWVAGDTRRDIRMLLDHVDRRAALFTYAAAWSWFGDIELAYREWAAAAGVKPRIVAVPDDADPGAVLDASGLLDRDPAAAVLAPTARLAHLVLEAAERRGLRVPEDVRIAAGVDGRELHAAGITALDIGPTAHAEAAVELLFERLAGRPPRERLMRAELRVRRSTAVSAPSAQTR